jgi:hypothetical protein
VPSFQRNGGRWTRRKYIKLAEKKGREAKNSFWGMREAKLRFYFRKCCILFGYGLYSIEDRSPGLFLFLNLAPDLSLCQEHQEGIRRSSICILGTKARKMMNESRISGVVVMATISFDSSGVLM